MQKLNGFHIQFPGIKALLSLGVAVFIGSNAYAYVPVGFRGIGTRFGAVTGHIRSEGIHLKIPFVEGNKNIEIRVQKSEVAAPAASKDLQSVSTIIAVNYSVNPAQSAELYQRVGELYGDRIIFPAIQESVKSVTAKFTAEELITKRANVSNAILTELRERIEDYGLNVNGLNIIDFEFSPSFNQAIESKVTAEQNALAAKNKLEQIKFEAEQAIVAAKGKAEAQRIEGVALKENPQVIQLRAIEKWNGELPTYMAGDELPFIKIQ